MYQCPAYINLTHHFHAHQLKVQLPATVSLYLWQRAYESSFNQRNRSRISLSPLSPSIGHWLGLHDCKSGLRTSEIHRAGRIRKGKTQQAGTHEQWSKLLLTERISSLLQEVSGPHVKSFNRFHQDQPDYPG